MILRNSLTNQLRRLFFLAAFAIGIIHTWTGRYVVCADGIPYLDIGDAYFRHDWDLAINACYSPLYSWILGTTLNIFKITPYWESTSVHFVNFVIYLIAFFCFDFFLQELIKYHKQRETHLPEWAWLVLGYTLFIWSSMNLITLSSVTPDMCVSAIVYLISGILLKIKLGTKNYSVFFLLGIILGLGYLAKAIMFSLAFVYLVLCIFLVPNLKIAFSRIGITLIFFLFVSGPFIYTISKKIGHLTFNDSTRLNYAWNMNETTYECWKSGVPGCPNLPHQAKQIFSAPQIYDYSSPLKVSDPVWTYQSYWYEGLKAKFNLKGQIKILRRTLREYFNLFFQEQGVLIAVYLFLFSMRGLSCLKDMKDEWFILIPPIILMFIYSLIHVESRYIGSFIVIFWLGLFSALKLPDSKEAKKILSCSILTLSAFMIFTSVISKDFLENWRNKSAYTCWQVTNELKRAGIKEQDKAATIVFYNDFYWARLGRFQVISDVTSREFWTASDLIRQEILKAFKKIGAKVVVAENAPDFASKSGWKNIKGTSYYFYLFKK